MDSVRAVAMLLGIVLHGAMAFMKMELPQWPVSDLHSHSLLADSIVGFIHAFRIPVFFIVAGFFTALTYRKHELNRFVWRRFRRLAIPYVLGLVTIIPILHSSSMWARLTRKVGGATWEQYQDRWVDYWTSGELLEHANSSHLWFLYYVIVIIVLYTGLVRFAPQSWRAFGRALSGRFPALVGLAGPLVLTIPTWLAMLPMGTWYLGVPLVSFGKLPWSFLPELTYLVFYGLFFAFGVFLFRRVDLLATLREHTWKKVFLGWLLNGLASVLMILVLRRVVEVRAADVPVIKAAALLLYSAGTWYLCVGFLSLFLRYFDEENRHWREWSNASYWIYLTHLPVVILMQGLIYDFALPWPVKMTIVCVATAAVLFYPYKYFISKTWLGRLLNG